jgi:hypothetical protein
MAGNSASDGGGAPFPWRIVGWAGVVALLLLPLVADAPWTLSDFVVASILLGGAGLLLELIIRISSNIFYRAGAAVAVAACLLLVWVNGAVGFLGDEDNPANLMFLGVIVIAVLGAVAASFRPAGLAKTMLAAAGVQIGVGVIGLAGGFASPGYAGLYEVTMGTTLFACLWFLSAGLFRMAAKQQDSASPAP